MGNQTNYHLYYNLDEHLLIAGLGSINAFPFHRGSLNSQKMVTNVQQEQQVRKAAALLSFEFRNRCYKLSCKWHCRNDFLPCLHNLLALYLGAQLWVGCPRRAGKGTELSAHLLACTGRDDYGLGAALPAERS